MSAGASGKIGDNLVFSMRKSGPQVRTQKDPTDRRTAAQLEYREKVDVAGDRWKNLTENEKAAYNALAVGTDKTGYNLFMSEYFNRLELRYKLDEIDGAVVADSSGNGNDGILKVSALLYYPFNGNANDFSNSANNGNVVGAILDSDRFGNANSAYKFTVSNGHYIRPAAGIQNIAGNKKTITISGKFTMPTTGGRHIFRFKNSVGDADCFRLTIEQNTGFPFCWKIDSQGGGHLGLKRTVNICDGQFHIINVTYNIGYTISIDIDGVNATGAESSVIRSSDYFIIGDDTGNSAGMTIDECMVQDMTMDSNKRLRLRNVLVRHKLNNPVVTIGDRIGFELWGEPINITNGPAVCIDAGTSALANIKNQDPWTISYWSKPNVNYAGLSSVGWYGGNYKGPMVWLKTDGKIGVQVGRGATTGVNSNFGAVDVDAAASFIAGILNHVCVSYDGEYFDVFLNNINYLHYFLGANVDNGNGAQRFKVNCNPWDYNNSGISEYDDIRVYSRALGAVERTKIYNREI